MLLTGIIFASCAGSSKIIRHNGQLYLVDQRDGHPYPVTRINGLLWTTRNATIALPGSSYYPNPLHNPIDSRGRTYTWAQAQEACPKGWRLPTPEELGALFLAYGKVAYAGELPYFKKMFGTYQPDSTSATYQALLKDKTLSLPVYKMVPDEAGYYIQRTLFWSSDSVGDRAYAVYWDEEQKSVHFSDYPKWFFGFCRFVKIEKPGRKQRQELQRQRALRQQQEGEALFLKYQFE